MSDNKKRRDGAGCKHVGAKKELLENKEMGW